MRHRALYQPVCPCGQPFTTSDVKAQHCSKKCSAYFRVRREGRPVPDKQQRGPDRLRGNTLDAFLTWAKSKGDSHGSQD